jgi:hypothetical protein
MNGDILIGKYYFPNALFPMRRPQKLFSTYSYKTFTFYISKRLEPQ